jgi:hypothetical protein
LFDVLNLLTFAMVGLLLLLMGAVAAVAAPASAPSLAAAQPPAMSCLACLECVRESGTLEGCLQTCQRHRVLPEACEATCGQLAARGTTCAGLGLCPRTRSEAQEHEKRVFGVHNKGEPAVVLT